MRRPPRRTTNRRWIALGVIAALIVAGVGGYIAYQNTRPTVVTVNLSNGQKDVSTGYHILFSFNRPVSLQTLQTALSVAPATDSTLVPVSGQTVYSWSSIKPLAELTTYTVSLKPTTDLTHRHVQGGQWTFTTVIVPHIVSITAPGTAPLVDGSEVDPGSTLTIKFNDQMNTRTVKVLLGTQPLVLKWADDDRSATISTAGMASGPLVLQMLPGGLDLTGHPMPAAWSLKSGLYYHDHEHTIPLRYPALIQVPNDEAAVDQDGLQAADMIFEYLAEGGITRLTAIYQNVPDLIGPMRSSRFISLKIARHYKGLLFQSGESQATASRAAGDPVPQFFDTVGYAFRTDSRYAPDNLMMTGAMVSGAQQNFFPDIASFTIPKARPSLSGGSSATTVSVDEHYSTYTYDPITGTYQKTESAHPYVDDATKLPLRIEMLIVFHTDEQLLNVGDGHGAHIHDFNMDSSGRIDIFYKGLQYSGFWNSTDSHGPLAFTLADGTPLTLPPGLVWIDVTA
jgi:hypothetical protein